MAYGTVVQHQPKESEFLTSCLSPPQYSTLGSAIQVMLCLKRAAKIADYSVCCRLAVARQHYLDTTTRWWALTLGWVMPRFALLSSGKLRCGFPESRGDAEETDVRKDGQETIVPESLPEPPAQRASVSPR
jgi:hypothetical protein